MNKNGPTPRPRRIGHSTGAVIEQMKNYCLAYPTSPSAVRRPELFPRGDLWIALLGQSLEDDIVGIGPTITDALRAFDAQYLARSRPSTDETRFPINPVRAIHTTASVLALLLSSIVPC